jgi:hypothetical protein
MGCLNPVMRAARAVVVFATLTLFRSVFAQQVPTFGPNNYIVDNTNFGYYDVNFQFTHDISGANWGGIALYWPEADLSCGPGQYQIFSVALPLTTTLAAGSPALIDLTFNIYVTSNETLHELLMGQSILDPGPLVANLTAASYVYQDAFYVDVPVIAYTSFVFDTNVSKYSLLVWHADSPASTVTW